MSYTLVIGLIDIKRSEWKYYTRPWADYLSFLRKLLRIDAPMCVFVEQETVSFVEKHREKYPKTLITPIRLDDFVLYSKIDQIKAIQQQPIYKQSCKDKVCPEVGEPLYNVVVNNKINFLHQIAEENPFNTDYFIWLDGGYGHAKIDIPEGYMWDAGRYINLASENRIVVNTLMDTPSDTSFWGFFCAHEDFIDGGLVAGNRDTIRELHKLYYEIIDEAMNIGIIDDDQYFMTMSFIKNKELFHMVRVPNWAFRREVILRGKPKKIMIFMTHATLTLQHARMTFLSLSRCKDPMIFDELIIYNTHQDELSNETLLGLWESFDIKCVKEIKIFDYDEKTPKTLGGDLDVLKKYCSANYKPYDQILLLKSDILLSVNYLNELKKFDRVVIDFIAVSPLSNAKESVSDEELEEYIKLPYAIMSSEDTYYLEDEVRSPDNDIRNRAGVVPGDKGIKYIMGEVKRDWSCHFLTVYAFEQVALTNQDWGGSRWGHLAHLWVGFYKSFCVHKYHTIVSKNRSTERPGEWGKWLL